MARPEALTIINRLLAVIDSPEQASAAARSLSRGGFADRDVTLLQGPDAAERIGGGRWERAKRVLAFMASDQSVDLATYEAALTEGRAVLALRVPNADERRRAVALLADGGAHFMNFYGRFATEDIAPWRGAPPPIHWRYHR